MYSREYGDNLSFKGIFNTRHLNLKFLTILFITSAHVKSPRVNSTVFNGFSGSFVLF